jgi:hypothetical protein
LETKQYFYATFVVLDTQIEQLHKNAKIIAELMRALAVLKSAKKQFTCQALLTLRTTNRCAEENRSGALGYIK